MQTYTDCYPCFLRQALNAARHAQASQKEEFNIMQETLGEMQTFKLNSTPPEMAHTIHQIIIRHTGQADPYAKVKNESTKLALDMYPRLKQMVIEAQDELDMALRLSIAGNIIDFGAADSFGDLWGTVERVTTTPIVLDHSQQLCHRLKQSPGLLFLADNAGETVFDRILIETLQKLYPKLHINYAVKSGPIINDATLKDAQQAEIQTCAEIIKNGSNAPGTILNLCSDEFKQLFASTPLIIAKGQANYETLNQAGDKIFCLLQVKCPVIARDIGVEQKSSVIRQSTNS